MELIEGRKYTLVSPAHTHKNLYYIGKCDSLCGQTCDCCGKELESGYLFFSPTNINTTYDECCNGSFAYQIAIGNTCKRKIGIIQECNN